MVDPQIILPTKPRVVTEDGAKGVYEIDNLYPGYGHTLGNSLRRIILSSLPGAAITTIKIDGVAHEFSTMAGVKEDVIAILLNLKKVRFKITSEGSFTVSIKAKGPKVITAKDIDVPGQVEVMNEDQYIAEITEKGKSLDIELTVESGLGYVSKEVLQKNKMEVGTIAVDAIFSPIRRVAYEVENMRVGDKTNHNRLRITIETDGSLTPREALDRSVMIMIEQLHAMLGSHMNLEKEAQAPEIEEEAPKTKKAKEEVSSEGKEDMTDVLKTRIDTMPLPARILASLQNANIRTIGGLARKKKEDLLEIEGMGEKGILEIKKALETFGLSLK